MLVDGGVDEDSGRIRARFPFSLSVLRCCECSGCALSPLQLMRTLLGPGFRCGFLGLLHQEIIQERIRNEYKVEIITTPPSITYRIVLFNGNIEEISNPQKFPPFSEIKNIEELFIKLTITTYEKYLGDITLICKNKRGICIDRILNAGDL